MSMLWHSQYYPFGITDFLRDNTTPPCGFEVRF